MSKDDVTKKKSEDVAKSSAQKESMYCKKPCTQCQGVCSRDPGHSGMHRCPSGHTWFAK